MSAPAPKRVCQIIKVSALHAHPKHTYPTHPPSHSSSPAPRRSTPACMPPCGPASSPRSRVHTSRTTPSTTRRHSGCSLRTLRTRERTSRTTCAAWGRTRRRAAGGRSPTGCRRASIRPQRGAVGWKSGGQCVWISLLLCGRVWAGCAHGYVFCVFVLQTLPEVFQFDGTP